MSRDASQFDRLRAEPGVNGWIVPNRTRKPERPIHGD